MIFTLCRWEIDTPRETLCKKCIKKHALTSCLPWMHISKLFVDAVARVPSITLPNFRAV